MKEVLKNSQPTTNEAAMIEFLMSMPAAVEIHISPIEESKSEIIADLKKNHGLLVSELEGYGLPVDYIVENISPSSLPEWKKSAMISYYATSFNSIYERSGVRLLYEDEAELFTLVFTIMEIAKKEAVSDDKFEGFIVQKLFDIMK